MLNSSSAINRGSFLLPALNCWGRRGGAVQLKAVKGARVGKMEMQREESDEAASMDSAETHISHFLSDEKVSFEAASMQLAETHTAHFLPDEKVGTAEESPWPKPLSPLAGEQARAIELERAMKAEAAMASQPAFAPSDIIYQDEWLFVINKPSGIYSGHVLSTVSSMLASEEHNTAMGATPASRPVHLHLANRLDRDTSGVMIVTKCKIVAGKLTRMFQSRKAKKSYVALCIGPRPMWDEVYVETGHGRSRWGAWRVYACEDIGRKLPEKAVVKDMSTHFSVLSVNGERVRADSCCDEKLCEKRSAKRDQPYQNVPAFGDEVLVRAHPLTGRTHQIRLHCQFLSLPLCGDVKYGGPLVWKGTSYGTHALHAESMSFRHPVTDVHLSLVAPLPMWATC